jgi:methionine-rich copper-binding protein CopC
MRRRAILALPAGLALARHLTAPAAVHAHVNFLESDPPAGLLAAMPERLVLRFSGPIEPGPKAELLAADSSPVAGVRAAVDQSNFSQMVVSLPPIQGPGAYTLLWDVVSLEDGHEQKGFLGLLGGAPSLAVSAPALDPAAALPADLDVQLAARPDEWGLVQWVTSVGGPTAPAVTRIQYRFRAPLAGLSPLQVTGEWSDALGGYASGQAIALAGEWQTEVLVRREGVAEDVRLPFNWIAAVA